jgi:hypothetical protein
MKKEIDMKTAITTRGQGKVGDVKWVATLKRYLTQVMGNCENSHEWSGEMYAARRGDFRVVAMMDWVGVEPKPSFTLWHKDRAICQGNDLRECFRRFTKTLREEVSAINRTIKAIKF